VTKTAIVSDSVGWLAVTCLLAASVATASPQDGAVRYQLLKLGGHYVKWGHHTLGSGATVTYAFANQSMHFEGARNCGDLVPIDDLTIHSGISLSTFREETAQAFRAWEEAADITFIAIDDPSRADILIGAQGEPEGRAFANVAYVPVNGSDKSVQVIDQALICFNPEHRWKVGFDGDTNVYDIRYTLVHEIGHAIGLDHPTPSGQVMSFRYDEEYSDLQPGDLRGAAVLYGDGTGSMIVDYRFDEAAPTRIRFALHELSIGSQIPEPD
jgi:hypothetical protein